MIEILHRAKRGDEWHYGCFCLYRDIPNLLVYGFEWVLVDKETVGRYTGLTDKNGTRIFEGDIVKNEFGEIAEVEFLFGRFVPFNRYPEYKCFFCERCEVIGNIHDNPELLEVEE